MKNAIPLTLLLGCFSLAVGTGGCRPAVEAAPPASDPYSHIEDTVARRLLHQAIDAAGGLEAWQGLGELRFRKYFVLYEASGDVEQETRQQHVYRFHPAEQFEISWPVEEATHRMVFRDGQFARTVDGQTDTTASTASLRDAVLSATFVISIPFKLLDAGVMLHYEGLDTLEDGRVVEVLRATYDPAGHAHHSTPDIWWHYFDREDHRQVAYMVRHADHYSYVRNLSYETAGGILFPGQRDSYRVDSLRNRLYLRASYEYRDYQTEADVE